MSDARRIGGIVVCGGQSRRMGRPKAWLPFGAETLLQRVVRLLSQVVQPIIVVAAPGQDLPHLPADVTVVRDTEKGRGPLQGLAAGLGALAGKADAAFLSGCDTPFLQPALVCRLIDLLGENDICVPKVGDYHHPLSAVYRMDVLAAVEKLLKDNRLRLIVLFEKLRTRVVTSAELIDADPELKTFGNLNTPEDYAAAVAEFTRQAESC
jgi:molybdenum cofactor guanylyltransferase